MEQTSTDAPTKTIGIDLSDDSSTYVQLDERGVRIAERSFATSRQGLDRHFMDISPARIVLEASTQTPWVARHLKSLGHEVIVANPRKVQLISKSSKKTDRNDANLLARMGHAAAELLSPVWVRSESSLAARATLRARKQLVRTRTRLISLTRAESKVHGVRLAACSSESFASNVREVIPTVLKNALLPILDTIGALNAQIRAYDAEVERLCKVEFPITRLLRSIYGVGPNLALAYATSIEDPNRFRDSRTVGAYVGLAPRVYQSGQSDPSLRITKEGDRELRCLLVSGATHLLRQSSPDSALKRFGRRIAGRGHPRDRARARIAVARKLAVVMHRVWQTGEVYDPLRGAETSV